MSKRLTTKEFIDKAREVYGDKYDYSKTEYKSSRNKVCIICKKHGEFWQDPLKHLKGSGCPICYGTKKKTTEEFILESKSIHGDKYTYEHTEYKTKHDKVCITCPKHGDFWVLPGNHTSSTKHGCCPKCSLESKRKSTEKFIEEARIVHGDKYDYSKVKYSSNNDKVCIICPTHGEFWQVASSHLNGNGCPRCGAERTSKALSKTKEEFIDKAMVVHGDKYDYSLVEYKDYNTKVKIKCPIHGVFEQTPKAHAFGQGCPYCGGKVHKDTDTFIRDAIKVHGDRYDYSKVDYVNSKTNVCIICKKHGEFWQTPNMHLKGHKCPKCAFEENPIGIPLTTEDFIDKARKVHGDKYNYDKVVYKNSLLPVDIICPIHGVFHQLPSNHLLGYGCKKCNETNLERIVRVELEKRGIEYVYNKYHDFLSKQTLDFYLPQYNVGIECQGVQHYIPVEYFGGDDGFKNRLALDERKSKSCRDANVSLYYFTEENLQSYQPEAYIDVVKLLDEITKKMNKRN